jgi:hypothetical protein
MLTIA